MPKLKALPASKLRAYHEPAKVAYATSDNIPKSVKAHGIQARAFEAMRMGLHIKSPGYNIYVAGESDLGRRFLVRHYLTPKAKKELTPPDFIYVYNFEDADAPELLSVASGTSVKLKKSLNKLFGQLAKEVAVRLERSSFTSRHGRLYDSYQSQRGQLFRQMNKLADTQGFTLDMDEAGGMTLYPLIDGKRLSEGELENLGAEQRHTLKSKGDSLMQPMVGFLRKLAKAEQHFLEKENSLEKETVEGVLQTLYDPLVEKIIPLCKSEKLKTFLTHLRANILEKFDAFIPQDATPASLQTLVHHGGGFDGVSPLDEMRARFGVNIFVDNGKTEGAPIIYEDHPTLPNLMGCIEREAEMGALITDFTLIKAGSVHKAHGGYLVLHVDDMQAHPHAWDSLLRALRSNLSRIEDTGPEEGTKTKGLHPNAIPLDVKVILIGSEEAYELLYSYDDRFSRLFKIKAHLTGSMARTSTNIRNYLTHFKYIIDADALLPFDRTALSEMVDYGSWLMDDQKKLSLRFPRIREVMIEASACASMEEQTVVTKETVEQALQARYFRSNLVEEAFMEEYDRKIIKVATSGYAVGVVNGLAISAYGDFEFGLPHQISCTVGVGSGGIVDLEREAQLGGPIHTKAIMILKSYLTRCFACDKPLIMTGSLGFEQSYAGIEGDSASGAELAALLSALANVPVNLSFAFTGAVSQSGHIMAVGGVTSKVEGFFEVCKRHGLTGEQGVLLPKDNIPHLMLKTEILQAVEAKKFRVYAVEHITEALEILTGIPAGRQHKDYTYTKGSLYGKVDKNLRKLAKIAAVYRRS